MNLQYQLSNGNWYNCKNEDGDRTEEFLQRCMSANRIDANGKINCRATYATDRTLTRDETVAALNFGTVLRNGGSEWYSECRCSEACEAKRAAAIAAAPPVKMVKCSCGHTIPSGSVMSASMGSSCPDCYDRLS